MQIIDTDLEKARQFGVCGYKNEKRPGFPEKIDWLKSRFQEGLKMKTLWSPESGAQGMIEYIPAEQCWRPMVAPGYMAIHCLFVGFKKEYKNHGYATDLVKACIEDARAANRKGVAVITRKGSFMVGRDLFVKMNFESADKAPPDFELMALRFDASAPLPAFDGKWEEKARAYGPGITIIRAFQCPYTVKNVHEMVEAAQAEFGIKARVVTLQNFEAAQKSPCPFGSFCVIHDGQVVAHHPVSRTRFLNILKKRMQ